jgi:N-acetylglucosaminyl-diphospho-decaprenol L-rhamnosyltransferase
MSKELAIIIVSYNTRDLLAQCLEALDCKHLPESWQVIVIDNASGDGSTALVRDHYSDAQLIESAINAGFAQANNTALQSTDADYVLFLNSDTVASQAAIKALLTLMRSNAMLGAISPMLRTSDGSPQAFAFGGDPTPGYLIRRALNRLLFQRPLHDWASTGQVAVDWISGACMMIRGDVARQVNGFDTQYFMYFEDADLCKRIRNAGYQVAYIGDVSITHIGGQSLKQNPQAQSAYRTSLRLYYHTHYGKLANMALRLLLPLYSGVNRRT